MKRNSKQSGIESIKRSVFGAGDFVLKFTSAFTNNGKNISHEYRTADVGLVPFLGLLYFSLISHLIPKDYPVKDSSYKIAEVSILTVYHKGNEKYIKETVFVFLDDRQIK